MTTDANGSSEDRGRKAEDRGQGNREGTHPSSVVRHPSSGGLPLWAGAAIVILVAAVVVLLGLLAFSITERRWEAQRPAMVVTPIAEWEPDNAVWGHTYPREYESYLQTRRDDTKTKFGGAFPRDYLEEDPYQVILFAGYGFGKDYLQARGHYHAVEDVAQTFINGQGAKLLP